MLQIDMAALTASDSMHTRKLMDHPFIYFTSFHALLVSRNVSPNSRIAILS